MGGQPVAYHHQALLPVLPVLPVLSAHFDVPPSTAALRQPREMMSVQPWDEGVERREYERVWMYGGDKSDLGVDARSSAGGVHACMGLTTYRPGLHGRAASVPSAAV